LNNDVYVELAELRDRNAEKPTIDGSHDEADLGGVGSTGEVGVNLLGFVLVQADEPVQDVIASQGVVFAAFVIREVVLHGAGWQLLLKSIDLVQEQNDGSLDEPPGIANRIKQSQGFLHTIDSLIFEEKLIVLGNSDEEKDGCDILEAMNPLLSF
jgi:hypothetical protein